MNNFVLTIFKGSTTYYPLAGSSCKNPTFSPSALTYSVSLQQPAVWANSPLKITFVPDVMIDFIQLTFPAAWAN